MLSTMRTKMGKSFFAVIVAGISLVFVFWGAFPDSSGGLGATDVASVGGEKVTAEELHFAIQRDMENYQSLGIELPKEMVANIKGGALQGLISQKLMMQEAKRLGMESTDEEIMEEIRKLPYFQDKDKKGFSVDLYKQILSANHKTPAQFEAQVRDSLTTQRLMKFLESRIRVTDLELEREFALSNETRDIQFLRFSREDAMKKLSVDEKAVEAFLADKTKEASIGNYYSQNDAKYNKPEKVCARHILKQTKEEKAPKEFLALKPTVGNFESVAKKSSDDPGSKVKGGDLGCFQKGMMDKAFEAVAFSSPINKVSEPVKSTFGWHYILVYKKEAAVSHPLASVKREIAEELLKRDRIEEIRKVNLAEAEKAVAEWKSRSAKAETTGPFNGLEGHLPKIGRADEILKAAFDPKAKIQTGPQVFEAAGGVIVAAMKEKKSADMAKFPESKTTLSQTMRERKFRAFMPAWMEDVKSHTKISVNNKVMEMM